MRSRNMRETRFVVAFVVATCLLCSARPSLCDDARAESNGDKSVGESSKETNKAPEEDKSPVDDVAAVKPTNDDKHDSDKAAAVVDTKTKTPGTGQVTSNVVAPAAVKVNNDAEAEETSKAPEQPGVGHAASLNSGALLRGFYVFVGLSVLAVAYIVFRSFRLNKSRTQMVRKYGVLAHKQDIEMRPLPLDEDDEDDTTVFDASGLSPPPRLQS